MEQMAGTEKMRKMALEERDECLESALQKLDEESRERVIRMADALIKNVKQRASGSAKLQFSRSAALELIAATGIFLNQGTKVVNGGRK